MYLYTLEALIELNLFFTVEKKPPTLLNLNRNGEPCDISGSCSLFMSAALWFYGSCLMLTKAGGTSCLLGPIKPHWVFFESVYCFGGQLKAKPIFMLFISTSVSGQAGRQATPGGARYLVRLFIHSGSGRPPPVWTCREFTQWLKAVGEVESDFDWLSSGYWRWREME